MMLEARLIESLVAQVREAAGRGLSLNDTRNALDLAEFRRKMAGDDKQRNSDFDNDFVLPASARAWKEARGEKLGPSPYED